MKLLKLTSFFTLIFLPYLSIAVILIDIGAFSVAKIYGYNTSITRNGRIIWPCEDGPCMKLTQNDWPCYRIVEIQKKYRTEIMNNIDFPDKKEYEALFKKMQNIHSVIKSGGIIFMLLISTIAFCFIYFKLIRYHFIYHFFIMISFLWLLEPMKLILNVIFGYNFYEIFIAKNIGLYPLSILMSFSILGLTICSIVFFKLIKDDQKVFFILGSVIGNLIGFFLWNKVVVSMIVS